MKMTIMKTKTKVTDRYVEENGVLVIRPLHPISKKPQCTDKEFDALVANLERLLAERREAIAEENRNER